MTWRDVSTDFEEDEAYGLLKSRVHKVVLPMPGYRLTKISGPLTPHVAFIVEKRE